MQTYDFIALDVETANSNYWTLCQVGLAYFKDGEVIDTWSTLVDPQTNFDEINISIHGITPSMVEGSIKLPQLFDQMEARITQNKVVHHTHFDRVSLSRLSDQLERECLDCRWIDSARVARRTWKSVRQRGYGLDNLSELLHIERLKAHDALDDAITAGRIMHRAVIESGIPLDSWISSSEDNYSRWKHSSREYLDLAAAEPDPDGPLFGEVVVFTGQLSIPRLQAAKMAYALGCDIDNRVTQKTTLLVVGDQDLNLLAGHDKSTKHRYAEELIKKGVPIRIIGESGFQAMMEC